MISTPWLREFGRNPETRYPLRWRALGFICLALFISQVDMTIVNVALPSIAIELGATTSELQWIMDAYSIVLAGFVLFGNGLADRFGRKGIFMTGLAIFGAASLFATFATAPWHLVAARGVMGFGSALFLPPALSLLAIIFVSNERPKAVGIWAATGGVATALGPLIGGLLLARFSWGSVFLVNVPVVILGIGGAALLIPTSRRPDAARLDIIGALLSVAGLSAVIFGVIEGPKFGWGSPVIISVLLIGAGLVAAFIWRQLASSSPMFDVRVFRIGGVLGGGMALASNLLIPSGMLFLLPQYLQNVRGESPLTVGLLILPFGGAFAALAFTSASVMKRFGIRLVLTGGLVMMGMGTLVLSQVEEESSLLLIVIGTLIVGAGAAYVAPPGTAAVLNALPTSKAGDGAGVNQITRQVGAAFGVAIAGAILAAIYLGDISESLTGLTPEQATTAGSSIAGAQQVAGQLPNGAELSAAADSAFAIGYLSAMVAISIIAFVSAAAVFMVLRNEQSGTRRKHVPHSS